MVAVVLRRIVAQFKLVRRSSIAIFYLSSIADFVALVGHLEITIGDYE